MQQHSLKPYARSTKSKKRVGRGGKKGTYSGKGMKGQNARAGGGVRPGFEGGQTPLLRRMPKLKGFTNPNRIDYLAINVGLLNDRFEDGAEVTLESLVKKGIMKKTCEIKLLGTGKLEKKLNITAHLASASARAKVEKAGGTLTLLVQKAQKQESNA
jgi:large subunit ribosomal protein L15